MSMHEGLPQFPGVPGPHRANGVRPCMPQLLPSVEDLFGCRWSVADGCLGLSSAGGQLGEPERQPEKRSTETTRQRVEFIR